MNSLSWLLYAAEALNGIRGLLLVALPAAGTFIALIMAMSVALWAGDPYSWDSEETRAAKRAWPPKAWRAVKRLAVAVPLSMFLGLAIPSKDTMMLIAASEIGETVLASKDVQAIGGEAGALATDSLKLLRKYVADQLNPPTPESE